MSSSSAPSSSSEDEDSEDENSEIWNEEDAEIPQGEIVGEDNVGNRIALNKMDWDSLTAVDILALFKGLCTGEQVVTKVVVYPSLFGVE